MPTVDIKSTYSAVGDGQQVTAVITASSVTNVHTVSASTAVWTFGVDENKSIIIEGIGSASANNKALQTTITAVAVDGKSITIAGTVGTTVTGSSQVVTWGTSDTGAFQAFNIAQQGVANVTLTIPAGIYMLVTWASGAIGNSAWWLRGVPGVQVVGSGSPLLAGIMFLGGYTFPNQEATRPVTGKVASVSTGASSVTLLTPSEYTRFQPGNAYSMGLPSSYISGTKAILSGIDQQGYGDPPNPAIWEFVTITNVNTSTGVITFSSPIRNSYLSTWPVWKAGVSPDSTNEGGPATLRMLDVSWDTSMTITSVRFYTPDGLIYAWARDVTFNSCTWLNSYGPSPTVSQNYVVDGCDFSLCSTEVDKTVENFTIRNGTTWSTVFFQSSSVEKFVLSDSIISTRLKGLARNTVLINSTIAILQIGPESYGYTNSLQATNCVISSVDSTRTIEDSDVITAGWTISNGVITSPSPPIRWGIPGVIMNFKGQVPSETNFKVLALNSDGSIITSLTAQSAWPNVPKGGGTNLKVAQIPYLQGYFENNTGSADIIDLSQLLARGKRFGEYSKRTYSAAPTGTQIDINSSPAGPTMYGLMKTLTITVSPAFTTSGTRTLAVLGRFFAAALDLPVNGAQTSWLPSVNLKTSGARTWTLENGWSGVVAGDSLANPGRVWLTGSQTFFLSAAIDGVDTGVVSIEITTDQGFRPVMPLRFHA